MVTISLLWRAPEVNPINQKARSIPFLNPISTTYGRTFFFSWFGFMIAFWSWYGTSNKIPSIVLHIFISAAALIHSHLHMHPSFPSYPRFIP
jgi:hypothetical protein